MLSSTGVLVTLRSDLTVGIGVRHRPPSRGRHRSLALINFCCPSFRGGFSGDFSSTFWRELCGPSCPASLPPEPTQRYRSLVLFIGSCPTLHISRGKINYEFCELSRVAGAFRVLGHAATMG